MDPEPTPGHHLRGRVDGLDPTSPFLRRRGIECGLTKHRLDGPGYTRIFGSVRLAADVEHRDGIVCHVSRAAAHGASLRARAVADLVRPGVDSPMETRVRFMLVLAGMPEPVVQHPVGDERRSYRLDLAWPDLLLAVEYDGRQHAEDSRQWGHDWHGASGSTPTDGGCWSAGGRRLRRPLGNDHAHRGRDGRAGLRADHVPTGARFLEHFPGRPWRRPGH